MGVDIQALKILRYARDVGGNFKRTLTVGRQMLCTSPQAVEAILGCSNYSPEKYTESIFLNYLGATSIDSIDASTYENASLIHDLNEPVSESHYDKFDSIFDGGCLEHIYDVPTALKNLSKMCSVGGQIIHVVPTNNQCGHGFWQFSPELFFTLYSEKNGYKNTFVLLGTTDGSETYTLEPPPPGKRHDIQHSKPLYVIVRTVKATENFNHKNIQQSDYTYIWNQSNE